MADLAEEEKLGVELCFCMDCTGSMRTPMDGAKKYITRTIDKVKERYPLAAIRLGFVAYRDHGDGPLRIQKLGFTSDVERFRDFIANLAATGGQDYPEDVLGGLLECTLMSWTARTRLVFHIYDAPPHGRGTYHEAPGDLFPEGHPEDRPLSEILGTFKASRINYYIMDWGPYDLEQMTTEFKRVAHSIGYTQLTHVQKCRRDGDVDEDVDNVVRMMDCVGDAVVTAIRVSAIRREEDERISARRPREENNLYKVYCGIDFGTHGSAFAFCTPGDPVARAVNNWGGARLDVKTLTNVLLGPDKKFVAFGDVALEMYLDMEREEQQQHHFFRRFKMALYKEKVKSDEYRDGDEKKGVDIERKIKDAEGRKVRADIVLEEALKFMVRHVMEQINEMHGVSDASEVQWILTVPAIWSQRSRRTMEAAAYRAGIPRGKHDQLIVALEPECAAVVAQDTLRLSAGACYMMVDCGGGTVDIACHEMISATEVKEIWKATGGPWGATYIDDEFWNYLRVIFGDELMREIDNEPGLRESVIQNFNTAKARALPTEDKRNVNLNVLKHTLKDVFGSIDAANERLSGVKFPEETDEDCGAKLKKNGQLVVKGRIWEYLFNSVINKLVDHLKMLLAQEELRDRIQTLCIVGGFAESAILMDRLANEFGERRRVVRPNNPMLTVVKGAARYGLIPTTIVEHCAPRTVGIAVRALFREGDDEERRVNGDPQYVDGVFFPFIRAGQAIPDDMPPVVHRFVPDKASQQYFQIEIYQTDDPNPRFVPDKPCGVIGPVKIPESFEHNLHDIRVELDFSRAMVRCHVWYGEEEGTRVEINWDEEA